MSMTSPLVVDIVVSNDGPQKENLRPSESAKGRVARVVCTSALMGLFFGFFLQKSAVFEPGVIRGQFLYTNFTMLKVFLAVLCVGSMCMALLSVFSSTRKFFLHAQECFSCAMNTFGVPAVVLGAMLLGAGMALSGSCPGMVALQLGSGIPNSWITVIGAFTGSIIYGAVRPLLDGLISAKKLGDEASHVNGFLGVSYPKVAAAVSLCSGAVVVGLEAGLPWQSHTPSPNNWGAEPFSLLYWPPWVSGALVGLLQIPAVLLVDRALGSSTSYMVVASQLLVTSGLRDKVKELAKYREGLGVWWQVIYIGSAIGGAAISAAASDSFGTASGAQPAAAFVGGFLIIFGSRLAGGCTSGHGLSGTAFLITNSFIAVPAMFAGGSAMAFALRAAGGDLYSN